MNPYPTPEDFFGSDPRRRTPAWDFGDQWLDRGVRHRISWLPSTGEVFVTAVDRDPIEVLATVEDPELLRAVLRRPDDRYPLAWARGRIRARPRDPEAIAVAIEAAAASEEARRTIERTRYTVVAVRALPDPDRELGLAADPCRCRDCTAGDWNAVADVAVALFELGFDPLDLPALRRAAARMLGAPELELLAGMYSRPIELVAATGPYGNGRHRAHALRRAGARRCVVVRR